MMMGALLWWVLEIVSGHLAQVMQPWFLCLAGTGSITLIFLLSV